MNAAADNVDSTHLLREFAEHRSDTAFAALVQRHLDLVYSVALRRCGHRTGLADEICQLVFCDLARKAAGIPAGLSVAGWLHQHTCFVAAKQLRAESRRQHREEIAMQLQTLVDDIDWSHLAPVLDDALLDLAATDREPLVKRFFGKRSFAEIGTHFGLSENAARMRVDRALDKLRAKLAKRGVTSTAAALAVAMAGPAVTAAPATLASLVTAAALATAVTTTSTFGLLTLMASTKLKLSVAALVAATVATSFILQHQSLQNLRAENARLRERPAPPATEPGSLMATAGSDDELARLRVEHNELLRLRGEIARLRSEAASHLSQSTARSKAKPSRSEPPGPVNGYQLFAGNLLGQHHVDSIKTMKLVGRALHQLANDADSLSPEARTAPLFADGQPSALLRQSLAPSPDSGLAPSAWGEFEVLVPDLATMKQLMDSNPGAIIARSKEDLATPDGRLLRIYGKADGSVLNLVHDQGTPALELGDTPVLPP